MTAAAGPTSALVAVLPDLRCPACSAPMRILDAQVACGRGHRFDLARQGYLNLITGRRRGAALGDEGPMVSARQEILAAGLFTPLTDALTRTVRAHLISRRSADARAPAPADPLIVDVGGGTGHHLAAVLEGLLDVAPTARGLVLDASTAALRRAARAHLRLASVGADIWHGLPLASGAAGTILDVFSPRNLPEFHRVLQPSGVLIVAAPAPNHLQELVGPLGLITVDRRKEERLSDSAGGLFTGADAATVTWEMTLRHDDVRRVVAMSPSARHVSDADLSARIVALPDPLLVTASVMVMTMVPVPAAARA